MIHLKLIAWHVLPDSVYPHTLNYRLIRSICDNDINELKLCLDSNPELANAAIYQGYKPLTLAASLNRSGLIDYLVLRGADIEEVDS